MSTNMLYLARYARHFGSQQRLEITRTDQMLMGGEGADGHDVVNGIVAESVSVKDFIPALKAICDKLEKAEGKVWNLQYLDPHHTYLSVCLLYFCYCCAAIRFWLSQI